MTMLVIMFIVASVMIGRWYTEQDAVFLPACGLHSTIPSPAIQGDGLVRLQTAHIRWICGGGIGGGCSRARMHILQAVIQRSRIALGSGANRSTTASAISAARYSSTSQGPRVKPPRLGLTMARGFAEHLKAGCKSRVRPGKAPPSHCGFLSQTQRPLRWSHPIEQSPSSNGAAGAPIIIKYRRPAATKVARSSCTDRTGSRSCVETMENLGTVVVRPKRTTLTEVTCASTRWVIRSAHRAGWPKFRRRYQTCFERRNHHHQPQCHERVCHHWALAKTADC